MHAARAHLYPRRNNNVHFLKYGNEVYSGEQMYNNNIQLFEKTTHIQAGMQQSVRSSFTLILMHVNVSISIIGICNRYTADNILYIIKMCVYTTVISPVHIVNNTAENVYTNNTRYILYHINILMSTYIAHCSEAQFIYTPNIVIRHPIISGRLSVFREKFSGET